METAHALNEKSVKTQHKGSSLLWCWLRIRMCSFLLIPHILSVVLLLGFSACDVDTTVNVNNIYEV